MISLESRARARAPTRCRQRPLLATTYICTAGWGGEALTGAGAGARARARRLAMGQVLARASRREESRVPCRAADDGTLRRRTRLAEAISQLADAGRGACPPPRLQRALRSARTAALGTPASGGVAADGGRREAHEPSDERRRRRSSKARPRRATTLRTAPPPPLVRRRAGASLARRPRLLAWLPYGLNSLRYSTRASRALVRVRRARARSLGPSSLLDVPLSHRSPPRPSPGPADGRRDHPGRVLPDQSNSSFSLNGTLIALHAL